MPKVLKNNAEIESPFYYANLWRLTIAQALAGANTAVIYATGSIVGSQLAPSSFLATLPISIFVVGMAACVLPIGEISRRYGRKSAFLVGTFAGVLTGLLSMYALIIENFWFFCFSTFFGGAYAAVVLSFRFAATDGLPADKRPQALSFVMVGGILAGVIGPQLVTHTMNLCSAKTFIITFFAQAFVAAISAVVLYGVHLPIFKNETLGKGRPLLKIIAKPRFISAVICGAVSYLLMNFLMTSAPLAMHIQGHNQESANLGIQWHVIAMYAPSFFTGKLIVRYGAMRISAFGIILTGVAVFIGLLGQDVYHFMLLLILLGVGWNFGFLGASALVLECHRKEETNRVQSLNDFIVFGVIAVGSFLSGGILSSYGWNIVLLTAFLPLTIAMLTLLLVKIFSAKN